MLSFSKTKSTEIRLKKKSDKWTSRQIDEINFKFIENIQKHKIQL